MHLHWINRAGITLSAVTASCPVRTLKIFFSTSSIKRSSVAATKAEAATTTTTTITAATTTTTTATTSATKTTATSSLSCSNNYRLGSAQTEIIAFR